MTREPRIYDLDENDLARELVGQRITAIDTEAKTITLRSGTVLTIEDADDCCSWYEGELDALDLSDNLVTSVVRQDREASDSCMEAWTLVILSAHTKIAEVRVEGDEGNGYYCHSVSMRVTRNRREREGR